MFIEQQVKRLKDRVRSVKDRISEHPKALIVLETLTMLGLAASIPVGTWALLSESNQQPAGPAFPEPTFAPGGMSVYAVDNPYSTDLHVTEVITKPDGFRETRNLLALLCSTLNVHLRDHPNIPYNFNGSATIYADVPITDLVKIVAYDYREGSNTPTLNDLARWADPLGEGLDIETGIGVVGIGFLQAVAVRTGINICSPYYEKSYDTANSDGDVDAVGRPLRDGKNDISDTQTTAVMWNRTYTVTLPVTPTISKAGNSSKQSSGVAPKVDMSLNVSSDGPIVPGKVFTVSIDLKNVIDLGALQVKVGFDGTMAKLKDVLLNADSGRTGRLMVLLTDPNPVISATDMINIAAYSGGLTPAGVDGDSRIADLIFEAQRFGRFNPSLLKTEVDNRLGVKQVIGTINDANVVIDFPYKLFIPSAHYNFH